MSELDDQIAVRRAKRERLRARGVEAFPARCPHDAEPFEVQRRWGGDDAASLEAAAVRLRVPGRLRARRDQGKLAFLDLSDGRARVQLFVRKEKLDEASRQLLDDLDLGDYLLAEGVLGRTRAGELSIFAERLTLLAKALRPLPEKWHGLADVESRYRQRYLDLIANEESRRTFEIRARLISGIRRFLDARGFLEVETPMMQPVPGGAAARPFVTHHNALDLELYLRIAPELYLKRLVVGGFERVYEVNRNFRNEGVSTQHNPEFTMLELYMAWADHETLIDLLENLLRSLAVQVLGSACVTSGGREYDLSAPFHRLAIEAAVAQHNPGLRGADLRDVAVLRGACTQLGIPVQPGWGAGKLQIEIFEKTVEHHLVEPTFVTGFPAEVSPLARRSDADPFLTDRFELYIGGREIANGFSELNDPEDQAERFRRQVEQQRGGDEEAMFYDADYVAALEYGLPPTAGLGIGVDRLVMFIADQPSIRDVLLFPHLRDAPGRG